MAAITWIKRDITPGGLMPEMWVTLNLAERGLLESVVRVIILYGPLPDEVTFIAKRIGTEVAEVEQAWPAVRKLLQPDESGRLTHAETAAPLRAAEESVANLSQKRAIAGKASASKRQTSTFEQHDAEQAGNTVLNTMSTDKSKSRSRERHETSCSTAGAVERDVIDISTIQSKPDPIAEWFNREFWPVFPRRQAKQDAIKAARTVLKTAELRTEALAGLKKQLPELRARDPKMVPLPATWIRGRRWEDEESSVASDDPFVEAARRALTKLRGAKKTA
jgi:hypothetical protein